MNTIFLLLFLFLSFHLFPQTKILFTAIDYSSGEVRATICDEYSTNRHDLGFNKTYLPVWFGEKILLNSDNFIWQCDTAGERLTQLFLGYRVSVSNDKKMAAFYTSEGINIADESGKVIKQIFVNTLNDAAITWSRDDDKISYFDPDKQKCFLFNLKNDSIEVFGDSIFHPLWNPTKNYLLFNRALSDGKFNIVVRDLLNGIEFIINKTGENALVPIWSSDGSKIAYLSFKTFLESSPETDLYACDLILFDLEKKSHKKLASNAGFTDKAFPQMSFDEKDEFLYFTLVNDNGLGSIARVNLRSMKQETIGKDNQIDERFPHVKTFR